MALEGPVDGPLDHLEGLHPVGSHGRDEPPADLELLDQRARQLERRFGDDEAIREIAATWNVPAQELHNAYKKARKEFYRCLKEVVAFHRPDATDLDGECKELLGLLS